MNMGKIERSYTKKSSSLTNRISYLYETPDIKDDYIGKLHPHYNIRYCQPKDSARKVRNNPR